MHGLAHVPLPAPAPACVPTRLPAGAHIPARIPAPALSEPFEHGERSMAPGRRLRASGGPPRLSALLARAVAPPADSRPGLTRDQAPASAARAAARNLVARSNLSNSARLELDPLP
jgi:hypothetical protein